MVCVMVRLCWCYIVVVYMWDDGGDKRGSVEEINKFAIREKATSDDEPQKKCQTWKWTEKSLKGKRRAQVSPF